MKAMTDFDRRLGDWLEDGPQTVPDWLVEQALVQAHATTQVRAGVRLPWLRRRSIPVGRMVSVASGAVAGLAVVTAFILGLLAGPRVGDEPTPPPSQTHSHGPAASVLPRALGRVEGIEVLAGETPDFASLIGLATTAAEDAVWTVVVTGDGPRLVRIDAATGAAMPVTVSGAGGILSPPVAEADVIWTGSTAGLHAVQASGLGDSLTLPMGFVPAEIDVSGEGLWVARDGGASLVDPASGHVVREVAAPVGTRTGRVIGPPALGRLWTCLDQFTLATLDPVGGSVTGTTALPAESDCHGRVFAVAGIGGMPDGVIPYLSSVVVAPEGGSVATQFDVGAWSDVVAIDGTLWFLEIVRDQPGSTLALIALDPVTLRPAQILTFGGSLHLNAAFESGYLAFAGGYLWVLADPAADDTPQIIRIPLSELRAP